jgi:hypothetical protein
VLVPRSSDTPVAAWAWPTWVVSRRHVLEAVFVLLESSSPSRRIFIGSHSLPALSGSPYRSFNCVFLKYTIQRRHPQFTRTTSSILSIHMNAHTQNLLYEHLRKLSWHILEIDEVTTCVLLSMRTSSTTERTTSLILINSLSRRVEPRM